jgi:eukaryotic-like serine/threonine-protein kinase
MDFCPSCGALIDAESGRCDACKARFTVVPLTERGHAPQERPPLQPRSFAAGETVGNRYQILKHLGTGGMGTVFLARDRLLEMDVALKIISLAIFEKNDPHRRFEALRRFKSEVIHARQVHHPNVVRIYDISSWEGYLFITMEYLEGPDLREMEILRGPMVWEDAVPVLQEILGALSAVHEAGLVHMDLKPGNVLMTKDGHAHLMDFGISRAPITGGAGDGAGPAFGGTPEYMAPEQAEGSQADVRSDIYAVGCVLYEMLTGSPPIVGESPEATMRKKIQEEPQLRDPLWEALRPWQKKIIQNCLGRDPFERYANVRDLQDALLAGPKAKGPKRGLGAPGRTGDGGLFPARQIKILLAFAGAMALLALAMLLWQMLGPKGS